MDTFSGRKCTFAEMYKTLDQTYDAESLEEE